jgi:type III secretion system FlhB-like substrate exporter
MSRTEKRREQQDLGGNPWLAQQRLERHREARLTLTAVQDATLLTHARFELVVLIRYAARRDPAPRVIGVAVGALASQCISTANDLGIAVSDDEPLTCALARCKPESTIPESLYARVAEILATLPAFTNPPLLDPELAPGLLRT